MRKNREKPHPAKGTAAAAANTAGRGNCPTGMVGIDITERKRAEQELRLHKEHLEELVKERTAELVSRNAQLAREIAERNLAEEALRQAKEEWERTFDAVPDLIAILDEHHRVVRANRAMAERLRRKTDECVGVPCHVVVHGTDLPPAFCPHTRTLADGLEHTAEVFEEHLGGYFLVSTTPICDDRGKLIGSVHVARDITGRRKAEEALRQSEEDLKFAQAVSHTGNWRLDIRRNELIWSDEAHRIFGIPKGAPLTYETFLATIHPDDREYVDRKWRAALVGEPYDIEHRIVVGDTVKWVRERAELEFDKEGSLLGGFGTTQDVTGRRMAEEALRKARDELEMRVQERTAELERRNKELQEFVFVASHDLREPLRKIQTFGDLVIARGGEGLSNGGRDCISRMQGAAARMQMLLESLLRYSRLTNHMEPFLETDINRSVKAALSNLEVLAGEKKARLEVGQLPTVEADRVQMVQLFQNLISNALKFQTPTGTPNVKIYAKVIKNRSGGNEAYEICVEDNGIGFDEQYLDKIFKPFQRLHGRDEYEGVGMGLAICRKIVERHGGSLTARATAGKGATFIVTLPRKQSQ